MAGALSQGRGDPAAGKENMASKINIEAVIAAVERDDLTGFCVACGAETPPGDVEPDAREYECPSCGEKKVFGAEEILIGYA